MPEGSWKKMLGGGRWAGKGGRARNTRGYLGSYHCLKMTFLAFWCDRYLVTSYKALYTCMPASQPSPRYSCTYDLPGRSRPDGSY